MNMYIEKDKEFYVSVCLYLVVKKEEKSEEKEFVPILDEYEKYISKNQMSNLMEVLGM